MSVCNTQPVLITCGTIKSAECIQTRISDCIGKQKLKNTKIRSLIIGDANEVQGCTVSLLSPGTIVVATLLASRGVDLRLDDAALDAGGLYLICTFPPKNRRVQEQVFGRTARNGQPGSGAMILLLDDVKGLLHSHLRNNHKISTFEQLFAKLDKLLSGDGKLPSEEMIATVRDLIIEKDLEAFRQNQLAFSLLRGRLFTRMCETMKTIRQKVRYIY